MNIFHQILKHLSLSYIHCNGNNFSIISQKQLQPSYYHGTDFSFCLKNSSNQASLKNFPLIVFSKIGKQITTIELNFQLFFNVVATKLLREFCINSSIKNWRTFIIPSQPKTIDFPLFPKNSYDQYGKFPLFCFNNFIKNFCLEILTRIFSLGNSHQQFWLAIFSLQ